MTTRPADTTRHPTATGVDDRRTLRLRDVVRGFGALLLLAALVVGVPLVLVTVAPISLPDQFPGWNQIAGYATRPDDGTVFLTALTLIAWTGWAAFTLSTLIEAVARARGLTAVRLPLLRLPQHGAAALIAAIAMALPTAGPTVRLVERPTVVAAATLDVNPAAAVTDLKPSGTPVANPGAKVHTPPHRTVVVQRYDTLWGLAERYLGDGHRYVDIAQLNYGRPQPDGATLDHHHRIRPGWTLILPDDARPDGHAPVDPAISDTVVVRHGDTLWDIARDHLGDPHRYHDLFTLNAGRPQPDGAALRDPDIILPGWHLLLPTSSDPSPEVPSIQTPLVPTPPAVATPLPAQPADTLTPPPAVPAVATPSPAAPSQSARVYRAQTQPPGPTTTAGGTPPTPAAARPPADDPDGEGSAALAVLGLGLSSLAAAGLVHELSRRRRRQQQRRRPGHVVPLPAPDAGMVERRLRALHDPRTLAQIQATFAALAVGCRDAGRDQPRIAVVLACAGWIDLQLAAPADPVAPFTAVDPTTWRYQLLPGHHDEADHADPPGPNDLLPVLVSLGVTGDSLILINVEAAGTLTLIGPADEVTAVQRALAVELVTSPLTRPAAISLGPDLDDLSDVVDHTRLDVGEQCAAGQRGVTVRLGVPDGRSAEPWTGTAVITSVTPAAAPSAGWTLTLTPDRLAQLEPLGLSLFCQQVSTDVYQQALDLLATADLDPARRPSMTRPSAPTVTVVAGRPHDGTATADVGIPVADDAAPSADPSTGQAPRLLLLGSVTALGADDKAVPNRRRRLTELVAYLALHPGATYHQLDEALWPGARVPTDTRNATVSRARRWLGTDPDGQPYLPTITRDGDYRLHPAVTSDWHDFIRLAATRDDAEPDPQRLAEALQLVRGRPFLGVDPHDYGWAEADIQEMISLIVDTAHALAEHLHQASDYRGAQEAATRGLLADDCSELLYRDAIQAAAARGDRAEANRLLTRLRTQLHRIDPTASLEADTTRLLVTLGLHVA